jgi:hypothetical protein
MKILVSGVISLPPFLPGTAWDRLHYVLGLRALGHDAWFVEEVAPDWCVDRAGRPCGFSESVNRESFRATMEGFGLLPKACQVYDGGAATAGADFETFLAEADGAELLINISGHLKSERIMGAVRRRAYLDQDPVYTQLWVAEYGADLKLDEHDVLFTTGINIGTSASPVPDCGMRWHHCLPPVVLEHWPLRIDPAASRFTTIASWGRFGELEYGGERYSSKYKEFLRFAELPARASQELELALRVEPGDERDTTALEQGGWKLSDAAELRTLDDYRDYIARSRAEIDIAKGAYVTGRAGWIGDRSCQYLASGKPVLAQSTGLERVVPAGRGLVTFSDIDEAVAAVAEVNDDYEAHCLAARKLAEEWLDARKVLTGMIERCLS